MAQMKIDESGTMVTVKPDGELPVVRLEFSQGNEGFGYTLRESEARELASLLLDAAAMDAR